MNYATALPDPRIPDYDDGVIDKTDYDADNVYAFIFYQKMAIGDTINLYWDNDEIDNHTVISEDLSPDAILMFHLPQPILTNGTHIISYMVTDVAGNSSSSTDMFVYVNHDIVAEKITAPYIMSGDDGCLTQDEINNFSGAIVYIPKTDALTANIGDPIVVKWVGYDEHGIPTLNGTDEYQTSIDQNNANGFNWTVPINIVLNSLNGGANVYYYIIVGAERIYSEAVSIALGNCTATNLRISLSTDQQQINADGQDVATITGLVLDGTAKPIANVAVLWATTAGTINPPSSITGPTGQASTRLTSQSVGTLTVTGTLPAGQADSIAVAAVQSNSIYIAELSSDQLDIMADGSDKATLTCTVLDSADVPVSGETVYWDSNQGNLAQIQTTTNTLGKSQNTLTTLAAGTITVSARLGNNSSKSIQISAQGGASKTLKIMGARVTLNGYGRYRRPRLVALDKTTLQPVLADWRYADNTGATQATAFIDVKPAEILIVSATGYDTVRVNISNIAGNGSFIDDGIGSGAFAALTDNGAIHAWGASEYGGITPTQSGVYDALFQNSHAFVAQEKTTNRLIAWGSSPQGGSLPSDISSRMDPITVRGGFASMAMLASNYPYVDSWGEIENGSLNVPQDVASRDDIVSLCATANAWVALDNRGHLHAWGADHEGGVLPGPITALDNVYDVVATEQAFAALFGNGQVSAWGNEYFGGDESVLVGDTGITQVFSTDSAFAALFRDGSLRTWGNRSYGGALPSGWDHLNQVVDVCSSYGAFAALLTDGTVMAWGNTAYGGDSSSVQLSLTDVVALSATGAAFAALKTNGTVVVWGDWRDGGDSAGIHGELHNIVAIYGNTRAFAALRDDKKVICWGSADSGGSGAPAALSGHITYQFSN